MQIGILTKPYPSKHTKHKKPKARDNAIATAKIPYSFSILLPSSPSELSMKNIMAKRDIKLKKYKR